MTTGVPNGGMGKILPPWAPSVGQDKVKTREKPKQTGENQMKNENQEGKEKNYRKRSKLLYSVHKMFIFAFKISKNLHFLKIFSMFF